MEILFSQIGDFAALNAAQEFAKARGFSVASMQGPAPIGLLLGEFRIAKWRNLTEEERMGLDGWIVAADKRNGPVRIEIFGNKPAALAAISRPEP
jgi:hypothetical protein